MKFSDIKIILIVGVAVSAVVGAYLAYLYLLGRIFSDAQKDQTSFIFHSSDVLNVVIADLKAAGIESYFFSSAKVTNSRGPRFTSPPLVYGLWINKKDLDRAKQIIAIKFETETTVAGEVIREKR